MLGVKIRTLCITDVDLVWMHYPYEIPLDWQMTDRFASALFCIFSPFCGYLRICIQHIYFYWTVNLMKDCTLFKILDKSHPIMAYCLPGLCSCQMTVCFTPGQVAFSTPLADANGKNTNSFWTSISTLKIGPVLKAWMKHIIMRLHLTWKRNRGRCVCVCMRACASGAHQSCGWK